jgi:hypothetical protein
LQVAEILRVHMQENSQKLLQPEFLPVSSHSSVPLPHSILRGHTSSLVVVKI